MSISELTRGYNNSRCGANPLESLLTAAAVSARGFKRLFSLSMMRVAVYGLACGRQRAVMTGRRGAVRSLIAELIPWPTAQEFSPGR
jgi:hypothetical protein